MKPEAELRSDLEEVIKNFDNKSLDLDVRHNYFIAVMVLASTGAVYRGCSFDINILDLDDIVQMLMLVFVASALYFSWAILDLIPERVRLLRGIASCRVSSLSLLYALDSHMSNPEYDSDHPRFEMLLKFHSDNLTRAALPGTVMLSGIVALDLKKGEYTRVRSWTIFTLVPLSFLACIDLSVLLDKALILFY